MSIFSQQIILTEIWILTACEFLNISHKQHWLTNFVIAFRVSWNNNGNKYSSVRLTNLKEFKINAKNSPETGRSGGKTAAITEYPNPWEITGVSRAVNTTCAFAWISTCKFSHEVLRSILTRADLPTPPDPRTTSLYSLIIQAVFHKNQLKWCLFLFNIVNMILMCFLRISVLFISSCRLLKLYPNLLGLAPLQLRCKALTFYDCNFNDGTLCKDYLF